ncbi:MAG: phosphoribosylformylglycinamidine synthase subunit PurQ [Candidatus Eisenbacteria bacterium]|uniref:Phosphoribosylformylglycinamidine synthase subunit PurQ n=1 Tax=Eiseniibacteriota bacterium TaxID=2212470 RepID=A0A956NC24_UNCEI|nr:phosphoribosylformylglycinamidine synthase subunit PurQ [Candidatus Eisenbacteria bacterium]MCB9462829.1 phosphoribosylformylglycinamidine synthase subunit PurQ [Candidatus Eisenbacteria bacterium]
MTTSRPSVAVIRFPGSNCEGESLEAVKRAGLDGRIVRWNEPESTLAPFDAYFLPGGFSYQDRIRAGAVAARLPIGDLLARRAFEGAPIVGICNGAQILTETGLVPDTGHVSVALAPNRTPERSGYYTRWVFLGPGPGADRCVFTRGWTEPLPMPTAHGEGRFVSSEDEGLSALETSGCLRYHAPTGGPAAEFPWVPNGSTYGVAGLCNERGNVLALMPHPDRALRLAQVPDWLPGPWGDRRRSARTHAELEADGPGMVLFRSLARALGVTSGNGSATEVRS